jgi:hypothetical protein
MLEEPSRRFREELDERDGDDGKHHLDAQGGAELRLAGDETETEVYPIRRCLPQVNGVGRRSVALVPAHLPHQRC